MTVLSDESAHAHAIFEALEARTVSSTLRDPALDLSHAYEVSRHLMELHASRADPVVGYKIGFTNPALWPLLGITEPMAGHIYRSSCIIGATASNLSLKRFCGVPQIEPELIFELGCTPDPDMSEDELMRCVSRVALGFEFVQSIYPDWKFTPAEAVAAGSVHGALIVGDWIDADDLSPRDIRAINVAFTRNGLEVATGTAAAVMGSPLSALAWLTILAARAPTCISLTPGDLISSGSMTLPVPVSSGEEWQVTSSNGLALPPTSIRLI